MMMNVERLNNRIFEQIARKQTDEDMMHVIYYYSRFVILFFVFVICLYIINVAEAKPQQQQYDNRSKPSVNIFVLSLDGVRFSNDVISDMINNSRTDADRLEEFEEKDQRNERRSSRTNTNRSTYRHADRHNNINIGKYSDDDEVEEENYRKPIKRRSGYNNYDRYEKEENYEEDYDDDEDNDGSNKKRKDYDGYYANSSKDDEDDERYYNGDDDELMPNLRRAYERFEDFQKRLEKLKKSEAKIFVRPKWKQTTKLLCARILEYLDPLTVDSSNPLPIEKSDRSKTKTRQGKSSFDAKEYVVEAKEYNDLLDNSRFQSRIDNVIQIAEEGKSLESNKRAFIYDERHLKKVAAVTKELLEEYEALRDSLLKKYPTLTAAWLPSIADLGNNTQK